ncbi:hypothetical protein B0H16DRAFT_1463387 [Mycena metata]|uniref:Uncharacterized protein n=1 Tax=Mycena metata TaxID=1033252 RepID=A0AAD7ILE9_9AGAR|nr:hypothetical protein B0H16DRAFT_1463387 [Mycena metata]
MDTKPYPDPCSLRELRSGSGMFADLQHFTVGGGTFNNIMKNYHAAQTVPPVSRVPPKFWNIQFHILVAVHGVSTAAIISQRDTGGELGSENDLLSSGLLCVEIFKTARFDVFGGDRLSPRADLDVSAGNHYPIRKEEGGSSECQIGMLKIQRGSEKGSEKGVKKSRKKGTMNDPSIGERRIGCCEPPTRAKLCRRVYSATIGGRNSNVTPAVYQGDGAEKVLNPLSFTHLLTPTSQDRDIERWPNRSTYWSLDPEGIEILGTEEAARLGLPSFQLSTKIKGLGTPEPRYLIQSVKRSYIWVNHHINCRGM